MLEKNGLIVFQNNLLSVTKLEFRLLAIFFFPFIKSATVVFFAFCEFLMILWLSTFFSWEDLFIKAFRIAFETHEAWFSVSSFLFKGICLVKLSNSSSSHLSKLSHLSVINCIYNCIYNCIFNCIYNMYTLFLINNTFISNTRLKLAKKIKQMLSNTLRLNFCYLKIIPPCYQL